MTIAAHAHSFAPAIAGEPAVFDMSHLDNPLRPVNILLILALAVVGLTVHVLLATVYGTEFSDRALAVWCWLYLALSVMWVLGKALRPRPHNWLSPDVVFWIIFTLFHLPYVVLYLLEWADFSHKVFFSPSMANRAMGCVLLSAVGFLIGYELGPLGREQPAHFAPAIRIPDSLHRGAHLTLIVTSVAAGVTLAITVGPLILAYGYRGFRRLEQFGDDIGSVRIVGLSLVILRAGVTLYVTACLLRFRRVIKGPSSALLIVGAVLFFGTLGARSEAVTLAFPVIIGYHYFVKRIRLWLGIPLFVGAIFLFGVIGICRSALSLSPGDMYDAYQTHRIKTGVNPFVSSLATAGGTLQTVNVGCTFIPSHEGYWYGRSIGTALTMPVPMPVAGWRQFMSPSTWATYRATGRAGYKQSGWGASIAMEGYINFGLVGGSVYLAIIGFAFRRIYDTTLRRPTFLRICLLLIAVTCLAFWCRNSFFHFTRPVAWTMLAAWLLWSTLGGNQVSEPVHGVGPRRIPTAPS